MTKEELQKLLDSVLTDSFHPVGKELDELLLYYNKKKEFIDLHWSLRVTAQQLDILLLRQEKTKEEPRHVIDEKYLSPDYFHDNYSADDEALFEEKFQKKYGNIP